METSNTPKVYLAFDTDRTNEKNMIDLIKYVFRKNRKVKLFTVYKHNLLDKIIMGKN